MNPLLAADHLSVAFGSTRALADVSFRIDAGEMVAIMGPSGSGKSTLLHVLAGLTTPDEGEVRFRGDRVDHLPDSRRSALRLREMGFVFQFGELVPELTAVENVELVSRLLGVPRGQARERALLALERVGVKDVASERIGRVSGGQAQRVAVARAICHEPALIFADEPTGALDTVAGEEVMECLASAAGTGAAVVVVTHDPRVAAWAGREVVLRDGRVAGQVRA